MAQQSGHHRIDSATAGRRRRKKELRADQRQLLFYAPVQLQLRILFPHGHFQFRPAAGRVDAWPTTTP